MKNTTNYNPALDLIRNKYGEYIFRFAIADLFDTGVSARVQTDLNEMYLILQAEERQYENSDKIPLMSADFKLEIVKCSKELAHIGVMPILRYIYCRKLFIGN